MNLEVRYRFYKSPPPAPILRQVNPVHALPPLFLKVHPTIILKSTSGFSKWFLSLYFPHQNPVYKVYLILTRSIGEYFKSSF